VRRVRVRVMAPTQGLQTMVRLRMKIRAMAPTQGLQMKMRSSVEGVGKNGLRGIHVRHAAIVGVSHL
jgi:hypothetical protein